MLHLQYNHVILALKWGVLMEKRTVDKALFGQRFFRASAPSGEATYSIAAALSISPGTVSRYANGLMAPKIPTVNHLPSALASIHSG